MRMSEASKTEVHEAGILQEGVKNKNYNRKNAQQLHFDQYHAQKPRKNIRVVTCFEL